MMRLRCPGWWPFRFGSDGYGRRTLRLAVGYTQFEVPVSRPGKVCRPDPVEFYDTLTDDRLSVDVYPHGGGERKHGLQFTVTTAEEPHKPVVVMRLPAHQVRRLGELVAVSQRMVWHDPRDAGDEFWNPQEET